MRCATVSETAVHFRRTIARFYRGFLTQPPRISPIICHYSEYANAISIQSDLLRTKQGHAVFYSFSHSWKCVSTWLFRCYSNTLHRLLFATSYLRKEMYSAQPALCKSPISFVCFKGVFIIRVEICLIMIWYTFRITFTDLIFCEIFQRFQTGCKSLCSEHFTNTVR